MKKLPLLLLNLALATIANSEEPAKTKPAAEPPLPVNPDKTLVAWVAPANLDQQGGSVLSLGSGVQFDAIVLGAEARGKWMAGADWFRGQRTWDQAANAIETAGPEELVQIAIAYQDSTVRLYRNGEVYAEWQYPAQNKVDLMVFDHLAVFGRLQIASSGTPFAGAIEDARIYGRALTAQEIQSLKPNVASDISPLAWWDFEGQTVKDRAGRFSHHALLQGATIKDGKLLLDGKGYLVAARSEAGLKAACAHPAAGGNKEPDIIAMPGNPPATWLNYHLAHPAPSKPAPADPNPAFFYKGRYHLNYIYSDPHGPAYAHVSSTDMVHWKWHPTTLSRATTGRRAKPRASSILPRTLRQGSSDGS